MAPGFRHPNLLSAFIALMAVIPALAAMILQPAYARPPSAVVKAQSSASVFVTVPPKVRPVTYTMGDKIWTIRADRGVASTVLLPAKASDISFSAGSILTTAVPSSEGSLPVTKDYTIKRAITLESLSADQVKDIADFIAPGVVVINPLNAKEREKALESKGPHMVNPTQATAPKCSEVHRAVKKYVEDYPERVLEVVALQISQNPTCACEVVKAAIIASEADTELVVQIVEAAIEVAPSRYRIIGQCAIAVAPDALSAVQTIINKYGAVSGDSGLGAKGGAKSAKGAKGGSGGDLFEPAQSELDSDDIYALPPNELQNLIDLLDDYAEDQVNPITVISDFRTDLNNNIIPSSVRKRRVLYPEDIDVYLGDANDAPELVNVDVSADTAAGSDSINGQSGGGNQGSTGITGAEGLNNASAEESTSDRGQGGLDQDLDNYAAFQVLGYVNKPGEFNLPANGKVEILTAITMAGGLNEEANEAECVIMRANQPPEKAIRVNLVEVRSGKKPVVFVHEGDIVIVKKLPL